MSQSIDDDATLGSKVNKFTCGNMNAVAFAYYNFSSLVTDASTVTVEFDFNIAEVAGHELISISDADYHTKDKGGFTGKSNTGYGSNGAIFNLGCYRGNSKNKFAINSTQNDLAGLGAWCHAAVTVDNTNKKVSYVITNASSETLASADKVDFLNSSAQKCTQIDVYIGTNAASNQVLIDNLSITSYVDESVSYADYTVVWYDTTAGSEIKRETRNAQVGSPISLLTEDKANFYNSDNTVKYVYASDDSAEATVDEDGTSVVTINFTEAGKYDYTVNAVDTEENVLTALSSGSIFDGDAKTVYWNKYIKVDGTWYVCESPYGITVSEAGSKNVTFTATNDITYFFDVSSMTPSRSPATNANGTGYSNGNGYGAYASASTYAGEVIEAGTYTLYVSAGSRRSGTVTFGISTRNNEGELSDTGKEFTWTVTGTENHDATVEDIVVPAGSQIALVEKTGYNSVAYLDYITLSRVKASKNISAAGYATFCSSSALDFSGSGLTAYIAKKDAENNVTFSTVTKVPANTGVLLKGEAGDHSIDTTTEATDDVTGNVLVGVLEDTDASAGSFVLMKVDDNVGFYKTKSTFTAGANTAYIEPLPGTARTFIGLDLDSTTTAIEGVATVKTGSGVVYNLRGQRVEKATKGLYILNGKKMLAE